MCTVGTRPNELRDRPVVGIRFDGSPVFVDVRGPGHFREGLGGNERAVGAVDDKEEAVLRRLHQDFARYAFDLEIREDDGLGGGVVPGVARCRLVVPDQFASLGS